MIKRRFKVINYQSSLEDFPMTNCKFFSAYEALMIAYFRWKDSEMCDVHAPTEGDRTFVYTCQNGQWTMHNFPISGVICGLQFE